MVPRLSEDEKVKEIEIERFLLFIDSLLWEGELNTGGCFIRDPFNPLCAESQLSDTYQPIGPRAVE
jgi:hypothetical protein